MRPETLLLIDEDVSRGRALHGRYRNQAWEVIWAQAPEDVRQFVHDRGIEPLVVLAGSNAEPADWHARPAQWIALGNEVGDRVRTAGMRPFATLDWPVELERLDEMVASAAALARAERCLAAQGAKRRSTYTPEAFRGASEAAAATRGRLVDLAAGREPVAIVGEPGAGKQLAARILHWSGRGEAGGGLVEYTMGGDAERVEAELFGREVDYRADWQGRSAGLVEQAADGTLVVHLGAPLSPALAGRFQPLLTGQRFRRMGGASDLAAPVRVVFTITGSANDAQALVRSYAGGLIAPESVLALPPLRERIEDIDAIAEHIIRRADRRYLRSVRGLAEPARAALAGHTWPGNVRELELLLERAVLVGGGEVLDLPALGQGVLFGAGPTKLGDRLCLPLDGSVSLEEMDRAIIATALEDSRYNTLATARRLRATRQTLRYRIEKYGLKARTHRAPRKD